MKMNSDDKFNAVIAFKIRALVYWIDLKNLIGVYLSAWAAAFNPNFHPKYMIRILESKHYRNFAEFPCRVAAFVVNSEPRTGARPSVRVFAGPDLARCAHFRGLFSCC
jgi:hypothetical protein